MAKHNLHFSDKEAAQNWAENYGGKLHDNTHTRGWKGSGTNYTVTEEWDDDDGECEDSEDHWITKDFPEGLIVYHWKYGRGRVRYPYECDRHNGYFQVSWDDKYLNDHYRGGDSMYEQQIEMLSFTPYTLTDGGYSRDLKHKTINNG